MFRKLYSRWMNRWETALTTRDENRVVRPMEWGFEWLGDFIDSAGLRREVKRAERDKSAAEDAMIAINEAIVRDSETFFGYERPSDFRLEERAPLLFPTNVRPETLRRDAALKRAMAEGRLRKAQFLRFTSPVRTPYPENDLVNARWYPAPEERMQGKPRQAIVVMPQWNADAFSHNILCSLFNYFGRWAGKRWWMCGAVWTGWSRRATSSSAFWGRVSARAMPSSPAHTMRDCA